MFMYFTIYTLRIQYIYWKCDSNRIRRKQNINYYCNNNNNNNKWYALYWISGMSCVLLKWIVYNMRHMYVEVYMYKNFRIYIQWAPKIKAKQSIDDISIGKSSSSSNNTTIPETHSENIHTHHHHLYKSISGKT